MGIPHYFYLWFLLFQFNRSYKSDNIMGMDNIIFFYVNTFDDL